MLRDLAAAADMPAASAHPYLVSFLKLGLVEQDAGNGRYRLGPFALEMGMASLRQRDEVALASEAAAALASRTGLSVAVAVWGNLGPTIVRLESSSRPLHVALRAGSVMSIAGTATGRVFGAYLAPDMWKPMVAQDDRSVGAPDRTLAPGDRPSETASKLTERLAAVRRRGFDRAVGVPIPGVNAFCAPVFDQDGQLAFVLTILGASGDLPSAWKSDAVDALLETARGLSVRLGAQIAR